jgi:hypothetical protein
VGVRLIVEALDYYHGEAHRKLWLVAFAEQANDKTRQGWPPRDLLARRADTSPSRASHIATELVGEGVLRRDGGGNRGGRSKYTMMRLAPAGEKKGAPSTHPKDTVKGAPSAHSSEAGKGAPGTHPKPQVKGARSGVKGARPSPPPAGTRPITLKSIPLTNPSSSRKREEYDDPAFAEFWNAYPRKVGKRAAWKAYLAAAGRGTDPAKIAKAALRYAEQRAGQPDKFTAHPATWLNQGRYDDEDTTMPAERDDDSWMR